VVAAADAAFAEPGLADAAFAEPGLADAAFAEPGVEFAVNSAGLVTRPPFVFSHRK